MLIGAAQAISVSISMSDGSSTFSSSTTANLGVDEYLTDTTQFMLAPGAMDIRGHLVTNGDVSVHRSSRGPSPHTTADTNLSSSGGELDNTFMFQAVGSAFTWKDNATMTNVTSMSYGASKEFSSAWFNATGSDCNGQFESKMSFQHGNNFPTLYNTVTVPTHKFSIKAKVEI
jgi:hypothetical protein